MKKILKAYYDCSEYYELSHKLTHNTEDKRKTHQEHCENLTLIEKELGRLTMSKIENDVISLLEIEEETAFQLGFEYACELMRTLGFGGVVNG